MIGLCLLTYPTCLVVSLHVLGVYRCGVCRWLLKSSDSKILDEVGADGCEARRLTSITVKVAKCYWAPDIRKVMGEGTR